MKIFFINIITDDKGKIVVILIVAYIRNVSVDSIKHVSKLDTQTNLYCMSIIKKLVTMFYRCVVCTVFLWWCCRTPVGFRK